MPMESPDSIKIIIDFDMMNDLAAEWNELAPPGSVEPWQSFSWNQSAAKANEKTSSLRIFTVRKKGKLLAIAPMVLRQSEQPLKPWRLDFLGGEYLKEPNRFVGSDPGALNMLVDAISAEQVYPVRLSRILSDNGTLSSIVEKFKNRGWIAKIAHMPYPYLNLGDDSIKKSLQKDLKRARKKAQKYGTLSLKVISDKEQGNLQQYLKEVLDIEASGWKGHNQTAIIFNNNRKKFFKNYAISAFKDGVLRLLFLMLDGKAVAVQYGVESANAFWLLSIGYNEQYRDFSPGNLLLEESIKYAYQNNLIHYNLLGKDESWTKRWTTTSKDSLILAAYKLNFHGMKAILSDILYLSQKQIQEFKHWGSNQFFKLKKIWKS
jgi:CelD/BcsL family acetyltransferase involved in cellulose biosynthesis